MADFFDEPQKRFLRRACLDLIAEPQSGEHTAVGDLLFRGYIEPVSPMSMSFRIKTDRIFEVADVLGIAAVASQKGRAKKND